MIVRVLVASALLVLAPTGCDGGAGDEPEPDVDAVVASIEAIGSVTKAVRLPQGTVSDKMLGNKSGYREATVFYDSRLKCAQPGIDCGAVLEVWADAGAAKERSGYLKALQSGMQNLGAEYHYRDGALLLRVNGDLAARKAKKYGAAFNEVD